MFHLKATSSTGKAHGWCKHCLPLWASFQSLYVSGYTHINPHCKLVGVSGKPFVQGHIGSSGRSSFPAGKTHFLCCTTWDWWLRTAITLITGDNDFLKNPNVKRTPLQWIPGGVLLIKLAYIRKYSSITYMIPKNRLQNRVNSCCA